MKLLSSILSLPFLLVIIAGIQPVAADDASCMRMPCLGKCISKEEARGKVFPMHCLQQHVCYEGVECTRLEDGRCGWKETPALAACIADKSANAFPHVLIQKNDTAKPVKP